MDGRTIADERSISKLQVMHFMPSIWHELTSLLKFKKFKSNWALVKTVIKKSFLFSFVSKFFYVYYQKYHLTNTNRIKVSKTKHHSNYYSKIVHNLGKSVSLLNHQSYPGDDLGYHRLSCPKEIGEVYEMIEDKAHLARHLFQCNLEAPLPYYVHRICVFQVDLSWQQKYKQQCKGVGDAMLGRKVHPY